MENMNWRILVALAILASAYLAKCIIVEDEKTSKIFGKLMKAVGVLAESQQAPEGDVNEMLEVLCTFIQAVVALSTSWPDAPFPFPLSMLETKSEEWSEWTPCSKTCGGGRRKRIRCMEEVPEWEDKGQEGPLARTLQSVVAKLRSHMCEHEDQDCNTDPCTVEEWSDWSPWTPCQQRRSRACLDPEACNGPDYQLRSCQPQQWGPCSVTCGPNGQQRRNHAAQVETRRCDPSPPPCPRRMAIFGGWNEWTECTRSCGGGVQTRSRQCGRECRGPNVESRPCNTVPCGTWSAWMWVSPCSASCGPSIDTVQVPLGPTKRYRCVPGASRMKRLRSVTDVREVHLQASPPSTMRSTISRLTPGPRRKPRASSAESLGRLPEEDPDPTDRRRVIEDSIRNLKKMSSAETVKEHKVDVGTFYGGVNTLKKKEPVRNSAANSDWFLGKYERISEHYQDVISRFRASVDNMVWAYDALQHGGSADEEKARVRQILHNEMKVAQSRLMDRVSSGARVVSLGSHVKLDASAILQQYADMLVDLIKEKMAD